MKFSATTRGFYPDDMLDAYRAAGTLPADLVEITQAYYQQLIAAPALGQEITLDAHGMPVATDPPGPTLENLRIAALASVPVWEETKRGSGITFDGHHWATTASALQDIRDALLAGFVPGEVWRDIEGAPVSRSLPQLQALWAAMVTGNQALRTQRIQMEQAIGSMTRPQLLAFDPAQSSHGSI